MSWEDDDYNDLMNYDEFNDVVAAEEFNEENDEGMGVDGFKDLSRAGGGGDTNIKDEREWFVTQLAEINGKGPFEKYKLSNADIQQISESKDLRFLNPYMLLCAIVWKREYKHVKHSDRVNILKNFHEKFSRSKKDKFENFVLDLARYIRIISNRPEN